MSTPCRLYLISPPHIADLPAFAETLAQALDAGDVAAFQLRLKSQTEAGEEAPAPDETVRAAVEALRDVAQDRGVAFILNDRPDLAARWGCDGVHIGQEDASYADARALLGEAKIVGVTCHGSRHLAMEAAEAGADYVAFGAFFPTQTKTPKATADLEVLEWWSTLFVTPCVAIGGIDAHNGAGLAAAGADFLAVSSAIWRHPDSPAEAVRAFDAMLATVREQGSTPSLAE